MISVTCWFMVTVRRGGPVKVVFTPQLVTVYGKPSAEERARVPVCAAGPSGAGGQGHQQQRGEDRAAGAARRTRGAAGRPAAAERSQVAAGGRPGTRARIRRGRRMASRSFSVRGPIAGPGVVPRRGLSGRGRQQVFGLGTAGAVRLPGGCAPVASCTPQSHTAARQLRIRTGFPDPIKGLTGCCNVPRARTPGTGAASHRDPADGREGKGPRGFTRPRGPGCRSFAHPDGSWADRSAMSSRGATPPRRSVDAPAGFEPASRGRHRPGCRAMNGDAERGARG